jgi:hypothetical protein
MRWLWLGVVACGSPTPSTSPSPIENKAPAAVDPTVAQLNQRAGTSGLSRDDRCKAVFELFDKHQKPGVTPDQARAVLTERAWIVVDDPVTALGGWIPVDLSFEDSTFVVHCYAEPTPRVNNMLWSDWVIYGRIQGRTASNLREFLASTDKLQLVEYALVYPDSRIEQYTPAGRNTMPPSR